MTGGNRGIGFEVVKKLLDLDFYVIIGTALKIFFVHILLLMFSLTLRGTKYEKNDGRNKKIASTRSSKWDNRMLAFEFEMFTIRAGICRTSEFKNEQNTFAHKQW